MLFSIVLLASTCLIGFTFGTVYFEENFDDDSWLARWHSSRRTRKGVKYGQFVRKAGNFFSNVSNTGIAVTEKGRFYGLSTEFSEFTNENKTLVLQYSVKYHPDIGLKKGCGGGYIQLFDCDLDPQDLYIDSPYLIKFGPDICGYHNDRKQFFVTMKYKGALYPINRNITWKVDVYTHVYTLIIQSNQNYEVLIDGNKVQNGNLENDWGFIQPKRIKDPYQTKPSDWDDQPTINDTTDVKPLDWDQPEFIVPGLIPNPKYKGVWKPRQLENPNYMGPWHHPEVANQYYRPDPNIYKLRQICGVGFSFWQGNNGTIFDNVLITNDTTLAEKRRESILSGVPIEREMWMSSMTPGERQAEAEKEALEKKQAEAAKEVAKWRMARAAKTLAKRNERLRKQAEEDEQANLSDGERFQEELRDKLKLTIFIATTLSVLAILIGIFSTFMVYRYRSKYLLTEEDLNNFIKGGVAAVDRYGNKIAVEGTEQAENLPYNKKKFEISPSSFKIDSARLLGSGEFGTVCCGYISREASQVEVAVKMMNKRQTDMGQGHQLALKGLISEIKILSYVGEHEYILKLEGAYTEKLRMGKVYVFLELCELGSLDKYLRQCIPLNSRTTTISMNTPEQGARRGNDADGESNGLLSHELTKDLQKWSLEIASAMEFLASKNIVHADLATRNVLLNGQKCAKIADFGLSRKLYNYTHYQKSESQPLPWKWMAPEALLKLIFTEKTDVWAFGITLWEMFTLGAEPYPGLAWDVNFATRLECGLRLPEPKYNQGNFYSVMQQCWNNEPTDRPTFSELKSSLAQKVYF